VPVRFLSDEWVRELKDGLNASQDFRKAAANANAKLQQVIATPEGERRYWIAIQAGSIDMGMGDVDAPDATISEDYETAAGLARGELNPVTAFMTGKLKVSGSMMLLMQLQAALAELPRVMAEMDVDY
jgi:putative sterol carrier protein